MASTGPVAYMYLNECVTVSEACVVEINGHTLKIILKVNKIKHLRTKFGNTYVAFRLFRCHFYYLLLFYLVIKTDCQ